MIVLRNFMDLFVHLNTMIVPMEALNVFMVSVWMTLGIKIMFPSIHVFVRLGIIKYKNKIDKNSKSNRMVGKLLLILILLVVWMLMNVHLHLAPGIQKFHVIILLDHLLVDYVLQVK